jgi:hypothetical protein
VEKLKEGDLVEHLGLDGRIIIKVDREEIGWEGLK